MVPQCGFHQVFCVVDVHRQLEFLAKEVVVKVGIDIPEGARDVWMFSFHPPDAVFKHLVCKIPQPSATWARDGQRLDLRLACRFALVEKQAPGCRAVLFCDVVESLAERDSFVARTLFCEPFETVAWSLGRPFLTFPLRARFTIPPYANARTVCSKI